MAIRTLRDSDSLDSIWEDLVFTEARLLGDDRAKEFAPTIATLLGRLEQVRGGQLGTWREEVAAQAFVSTIDDQLDDWIRALDTALLGVVAQDTQSARYRRYFSATPSSIIRLGLESEIARVRSWADSLATEQESNLKELGARLSKLIEQGDQAIERRRKAATSRTDHRVRAITSLIDDINGARLSLFGTLTKMAAEQRLPSDWANRFFRRTTRGAKAESQVVTPST